MPPFSPPLKNDGPACRVCGCTEYNACFDEQTEASCGWAILAKPDATRGPLCTACSGTTEDAIEVLGFVGKMLNPLKKTPQPRMANFAAKEAVGRLRKRKKEVDAAR